MSEPGLDPQREPRWLEREWFAPVAVEVPLDAADIEAFEQGRDLVDGLQELVPRQIRCAGQLAVELCAVRRRNGGAEVRGLRTDCMRRCAAR